MKRILVVEPNPFHGEVVPGIVYYFHKLGYDVTVLMQEKLIKEDAFCKDKQNCKFETFKMDELPIRLGKEDIKLYDFIFFTSLEVKIGNTSKNVIEYLEFEPKSKYGILGIVHDVSIVEKDIYRKFVAQNRVFGLTKKQCEKYELMMLNPNYFGESLIEDKENKICKFTIIGSAFDERRIEEAVGYLLERDITDFLVNWISGQYSKSYVIFNKIAKMIIYSLLGLFNMKMHRRLDVIKHIKWFSRLDFADIYSLVEKTDYCICMVENENEEFSKYYNKLTSGQKQLTLGFCKITLWEEKLAEIYGFSEKNSILIKNNDIGEAMLKALTISQKEQSDKKDNLRSLQLEMENESINNLKRVIEEICNK